MEKTTLSSKFQMVVPKNVRKKMCLKPGIQLLVYSVDSEHALIIKKPQSCVDALDGLGKDVWKKLGGADKFISKERNSW